MKNRLIAGLAAVAAALALVAGGSLAATASQPTQVKASTASVANDTAVFARLTRTTSTLTAANGSYTNLSGTSHWVLDEAGGFVFDSSGLHVPVDGIYEISWSTILTSGGSGIVGVATDGQTPHGGILQAIGPVVNLAAGTGNGSSTLFLPADTELDLWGYGSGSSISFQDMNSPAVHWTVTLIQ